MLVTLEVSVKLSGWLNALAWLNIYLHQAAGADVCVRRRQVLWPEDRGREADVWTTPHRQDVYGRRTVPAAPSKVHHMHTHTPPGCTYSMMVTLEVLNLSDWLNAVAH